MGIKIQEMPRDFPLRGCPRIIHMHIRPLYRITYRNEYPLSKYGDYTVGFPVFSLDDTPKI
jgi:hypothetical protein